MGSGSHVAADKCLKPYYRIAQTSNKHKDRKDLAFHPSACQSVSGSSLYSGDTVLFVTSSFAYPLSVLIGEWKSCNSTCVRSEKASVTEIVSSATFQIYCTSISLYISPSCYYTTLSYLQHYTSLLLHKHSSVINLCLCMSLAKNSMLHPCGFHTSLSNYLALPLQLLSEFITA